MTAKCVEMKPGRTWTGRNGDMQQYTVKFDNGDTGEYSCEIGKAPKFTVGATANYEVVPNGQFGNKIKPVQAAGFGGGGGGRHVDDDLIIAQVAVKGAIELINAGKADIKDLAAFTLRIGQVIKGVAADLKK